MEEQILPVKYHPSSKRAALIRVIRDLQRFNEEQLKILINMAHKVRRSKIQLAMVAQEAERLMAEMPAGRGSGQNSRIEGEKKEEPEIISSGSLLDS